MSNELISLKIVFFRGFKILKLTIVMLYIYISLLLINIFLIKNNL